MILARRRYEEHVWEEIEFTDYEQTTDDGHNVSHSSCTSIGGVFTDLFL
jgi:hypothetical protein